MQVRFNNRFVTEIKYNRMPVLEIRSESPANSCTFLCLIKCQAERKTNIISLLLLEKVYCMIKKGHLRVLFLSPVSVCLSMKFQWQLLYREQAIAGMNT